MTFMLSYSIVMAQTFTDRDEFLSAVKAVNTIDFEGIALGVGQAYAVNLVGNEFPGVTLTAGAGSDGLFVGIPDPSISDNNNENFFAGDFFPTSGLALFSPDNYPSPDSPSPTGVLIVDFDEPTSGVGAYFLDAEEFPSFIEAFDGPQGTGKSLGKLIVQNKGDNSQAFAGIMAEGIRSAVFGLGGGRDGVGIDDLCFGQDISCGKNGNKVLLCHKGKTICVSEEAVSAHLAHGDYYGSCTSSNRKNKSESIVAHTVVQDNQVIIHPNSFRNSFTVSIKQDKQTEDLVLKLYDLSGRPVKMIRDISSKQVQVDMSEADKGIYLYRVQNNSRILQTGKIVKK